MVVPIRAVEPTIIAPPTRRVFCLRRVKNEVLRFGAWDAPARPGEVHVCDYTRDRSPTHFSPVPGGGDAAAGNSERRGGEVRSCSDERNDPPGEAGGIRYMPT